MQLHIGSHASNRVAFTRVVASTFWCALSLRLVAFFDISAMVHRSVSVFASDDLLTLNVKDLTQIAN
jgi:hypothetical protein